jgi:hypothetical protein
MSRGEIEMEEIKTKSVVEAKINELLNTASVLEKFKGWIEPQDYFSVQNSVVSLWPDDEANSRRYVGALIRIFKAKPRIEKGPAQLTAVFNYNGVVIRVINYKTKKCVKVVKKIVHEAEPEKVIPAKPGWVEEVEELVCEMPAVETEVATAAPQEMPL